MRRVLVIIGFVLALSACGRGATPQQTAGSTGTRAALAQPTSPPAPPAATPPSSSPAIAIAPSTQVPAPPATGASARVQPPARTAIPRPSNPPAAKTGPGPRATPAAQRPRTRSMYVSTPGYIPAKLRSRPGTEYPVVASIPYGTSVQVASEPVRSARGNRWYEVTYASRMGYVQGKLLSEERPTLKPAAATAPKPASPKPAAPKQAPPKPAPPKRVAKPSRFVINTGSVKVNAPVEYLGLTENGGMASPKGWWNVGWYRLGTVPGQPGNAVIAGHLDATKGKAVFWRLRYLKPGDIVSVTDTDGKITRFRVRKTRVYHKDNFPLNEVFGPSEGAHLNLITCDGTWNRSARVYDKRMVVYTDKVGQ